jgi:hypothetical protein
MSARRLALAALWALGAALFCLGLTGLLHSVWPGLQLKLSLALSLSVLGGMTVFSYLFWRSRYPTALDAARLTERQHELHELLSTALELTDDSGRTAAGDLSSALALRVRQQADEAASRLAAREVRLPGFPRRLGLLLAALALTPLLWRLPAATVQAGRSEAAAPIIRVETPAPAEMPQAASPPTAAGGQASGQPGQPQNRAATAAPQAQVESTPSGVRRESATALGSTSGVTGTQGGAAGGRSQDSPFGSRESAGQAGQNQAKSGTVLAAAPYDPGAGQGKAAVQKTGGQTGERQASGGRGLESDSRERCSDSCLTNNSMNRSQAARQRTPATGDESRAGTSDSGGAAAASTSVVGLGQGQAQALPGQRRSVQVGTGVGAGARVQVLGLNTASAADISGGIGSGGWLRQAEAPLAASSSSGEDQAVIGQYFARSTGPLSTSATGTSATVSTATPRGAPSK